MLKPARPCPECAAAMLALLLCSPAGGAAWSIVTRPDENGHFKFYNQTNATTFHGPIQFKGVSMTGFETGAIGSHSGAAGYWMFEAKDDQDKVDFPTTKLIIHNIVTTLITSWGANIVRVPICGSAWLQDYNIADYGPASTKLMGYRDWVDIVVKAVTDLGAQVVLDNHVWAIAPQTGTVRNVGLEDGCNGINHDGSTPPVTSCAKSDWYGEYTSTRLKSTGTLYNKGHDPFEWQCPISNSDGVSLANLQRGDGVNPGVKGLEHFLNLWYEIALRYRDNPSVWFELFNEPYSRGSADPGAGAPDCQGNGPGTSIVCRPGTGQGDPTPERAYDWAFWSSLMNQTIHVIRNQAKASNIVLVAGFDFNYDYLGDGTPTSGGPIARPSLVQWRGPAAPPMPNVAFSFHPYQHGACCGEISDDDGKLDLSATDPYQASFCVHGTDPRRGTRATDWPPPGTDASLWPWSPSHAATPLISVPNIPQRTPDVHCSSTGYTATLDKKLPPCQWAPDAVRPEWYDAVSKTYTQQGLCVGQNSTCAHLPFEECCSLPENQTAAGGWARYVQPMEKHGPLIATEFGTFDCSSPFITSFLGWCARHNVSYTAWALWPLNNGGPGSGACGYPSVLQPTGGGATVDYLFSNGETNCKILDDDGTKNHGCAALLQFLGYTGKLVHDNIKLGVVPAPPGCPASPPPAPPSPPPLPTCTGGTMTLCVQECRGLPMDEQKMCVVGCVEQCNKRRKLFEEEEDDAVAQQDGAAQDDAAAPPPPAPRSACSANTPDAVRVSTFDRLLKEVEMGSAACVLVAATHINFAHRLEVGPGRAVAIAPAASGRVSFVGPAKVSGVAGTTSVIHVAVGGSLAMERIDVTGGRSSNSDAGIGNSGTLLLRDCKLYDNSATNTSLYAGGLGNNGTATLIGSEVGPNNHAAGKYAGGGIANSGTLVMNDTVVHGNTASYSGGGIGNDKHLEMNNCTVHSNEASFGGGGGLGNSGSVQISASRLFNNTAKGGGAIGTGIGHYYNTSAANDNQSSVDLRDSELYDNRATGAKNAGGGGGAIGNGAILKLRNCTLRNNTALSGGGAIGTGGDPKRRGDFASVDIADSALLDNSAQSGGGLGNQYGGYVSMARCVVSGNQADGNGGGLSNLGWVSFDAEGRMVDRMYTVLYVSDSNVIGNVAKGNGGGVSIDDFSDALLVRVQLLNNNASRYGGGVCNTGSELSMSGCLVSGNWVKQGGGGLTQANSVRGTQTLSPRSVLSNCTLVANHADNLGGGVYKLNGNATLNSVAIVGNAAYSGGGMHSNSATEKTAGGLVAFSDQDFTTVVSSNITNNTASYGAGVANYGKRCFLQNGTLVSGNVLIGAASSVGAGSAIYNTVPGGLSYVLPAPMGRYVDASFVCHKVHCDYGDGCPQTCDWQEYDGRTMVQLPLTVDAEYPSVCGKGFFGNDTEPASQNTSRCTGICPLGHFCADVPTYTPRECPVGTFAFSLGLADKGECAYCPPNSFANSSVPADQRTRSQACILCGLNSGTGGRDGRTNVSACRCEDGYYRAQPDDNDCAPCPPGALCTDGAALGSLRLCPGFWRPSFASGDIRPCKSLASCIGNLPRGTTCRTAAGGGGGAAAQLLLLAADDGGASAAADDEANPYCAPGLTGPLCSLCLQSDHFHDDDAGTCDSCATSRAVLLGGLGALALLALAVAVTRRSQACRVSLKRWVARSARCCGVRGSAAERWHEVRLGFLRVQPRLRVLAKQTITFYQIVTHVPEVYLVALPSSYKGLLKRLGVFNLNPSSLQIQLKCLGMATFFGEILGLALVPLCVVAAALATAKLRGRPLLSTLRFVLFFTFLTFSFVSSKAFQSFTCDCFDNGRVCFLQADYSIVCRRDGAITPQWARVLGLSWVVLLLYPIGVPVLYASLILSAGRRGIQRRETSLSDAMLFLMDDYRPRFYWFELAETAKKLVLAGFMVLIVPGTVSQLVVGLVLVVFYLVIQLYAMPFKRPEHNMVALASNLLIAVLLLSLIVLDEQFLYEEVAPSLSPGLRARFDLAGLSNTWVLFACTLGLLLAVGLLFAQDMRASRHLPTLRWRANAEAVRTPPPKAERGFHVMVSHVWATGQDQARIIAQGLAWLQPELRVFLDVDELQTIGAHIHTEQSGAPPPPGAPASLHSPSLLPWVVAPPPSAPGGGAGPAEALCVADSSRRVSGASPRKLHLLRASRSVPVSLEDVVARSDSLLVFVSDGFFSSASTLRELNAAVALGKPLVLVLEEDPKHGGAPLATARAECPPELRERVFGDAHPLIPWHRASPFQLVSLRQIAAAVLAQHAAKHGRAAPRLVSSDGRPVEGADVYASTELGARRLLVPPPSDAARRLVRTATAASQAKARRLLLELLEKADAAPPAAAVVGGAGGGEGGEGSEGGEGGDAAADHFLLYINAAVDLGEPARHSGATLADEVEVAIDRGQHIVIVFEGGAPLDDIIRRTPPRLRAKGLYNELVVPLHDGEHRGASLQLLARALRRPTADAPRPYDALLDAVTASSRKLVERLRAASSVRAASGTAPLLDTEEQQDSRDDESPQQGHAAREAELEGEAARHEALAG